MIVQKFIPLRSVLTFAGAHLIWLSLYSIFVALLYNYVGWKWVAIPWLPVTLIGTAVAFYLGFKNSQAYDRTWEARKIWGAIVNSSRSWGVMVNSFIDNPNIEAEELSKLKTKLIFRHIAWLYTLREQLLEPTPWEHVSLGRIFGTINVKRKENYGIGKFTEYLSQNQETRYFAERNLWEYAANPATQIIGIQSKELMSLKNNQHLDLFHQIELQNMLNEFYTYQGQAERIKKFPFPRQFANSSFLLNSIFIFLLPLGMANEFSKLGDIGIWFMVPLSALVSWVFIIMELVGDYSENPFEGLVYDIPMLSICRTIEIDLLQLSGETDIPKPIQSVNNVMM
ncbi:MAG: hypothetical protein KA974_06310 [Saprospiraceae bacterium]|nr:hypothetical protein [Saprospiraceae bacterium]